MITKVSETIKNYSMISGGERVTVALSGGADSMSLLYCLLELREELGISLCAAHVNHCLRGQESDGDEQFTRDSCQALGVPLEVLRADIRSIAKEGGEGIEECGRRVRYAFLQKCAGDGLIATAHTLSDSVETVLFNLARGTSLKGLCGIPPVRGRIIRPLIECTRGDVENYCSAREIRYVTDSTNNTDKYARNRIRHGLVPGLEKMNPAFWDAALRMIRSNIADEEYLSGEARRCLAFTRGTVDAVDAVKLASFPRPVRMRALAIKAAQVCGKSCETKHIEKMDSLLLSGGQTVICGGVTARVRLGELDFLKGAAPVKWSIEAEEGRTPVPMGYLSLECVKKTKYDNSLKVHRNLAKHALDFDKICGQITVRSRLEGDSIRIDGRGVTKTLKKLFNEAAIAPEKRLSTAVLADETGVIWVDGFGCDERCAVDNATQRVLLADIISSEGKTNGKQNA